MQTHNSFTSSYMHAVSDMNSIKFLDRTIFDWVGLILAAKVGPTEPNLSNKNYPPRPLFDQDQNFHYRPFGLGRIWLVQDDDDMTGL